MERLGSILLVDDEKTFVDSTCRLLRRKGFDCNSATDGDEGLALLRANRFDLMIADIRMPGNCDLRLVREARELDSQMPVILVTGYPSTDTAIHSIDLSVAGYLTKPVDLDELLSHVRPAVTHSRKQRSLTAVLERLQSCIDDLISTQWKPVPRLGGKDELIPIGTIRILAACLSELLAICCRSGEYESTDNLCELLDCPQRSINHEALVETITVLRKTKDTFKSKELADLRKKLEYLLGAHKGFCN